MNNCYILILILLASLLTPGCKKYLTVIPESEYSVEGAYSSQDDFEQAIAGVYSQLQHLYRGNAPYFRGLIARSDDTQGGSNYLEGLDQFTDNENNVLLSSAWNDYWKIIALSNLILERIDAGVFHDEASRAYIKGEAYMFRAYGYWSLAWQFGGMPLFDRSLPEGAVRQVARASQQATFDFAIEDYKKAIGLLPPEWGAKHKGRVTKYAAEGMLARLYMFRSEFDKAKPLLEDIIGSKKYDIEITYKNCFTDSHDNGLERVWEVQFSGGQLGQGQAFSSGCLPEKFKNPAVMPFTGFSTAMLVSDNLYYSYEAGDIRRDLSIIKGFTSTTGIKDTSSKFIIKYTHYDTYTPKDQYDWANNIPILRYTDVKMMYAEVLNEEGFMADGEAFKILNRVRDRAGLGPLTDTDLPGKDAFRNALIKERRVEFAFEGLRWPDLIRWGIAQTALNKFLEEPKEGGGRYSMEEYQKIFPIPFDEISRYNDKTIMWQNTGY